jgi:hypothetical protein
MVVGALYGFSSMPTAYHANRGNQSLHSLTAKRSAASIVVASAPSTSVFSVQGDDLSFAWSQYGRTQRTTNATIATDKVTNRPSSMKPDSFMPPIVASAGRLTPSPQRFGPTPVTG